MVAPRSMRELDAKFATEKPSYTCIIAIKFPSKSFRKILRIVVPAF